MTTPLRIAVVAIVVLSSACTTIARRLSDDHRAGKVSVWVHSPHVAAGDELHLEVGVYDDPRVGIHEVRVFINGVLAQSASGVGNDWGRSIASSDKSFLWEDSDFVHLRVPIPEDAKSTVHVEVEVRYVYTLQLGKKFSNHDDKKSIKFKVKVLSPTMRTVRRALSGLAGLGMLVAVWMLLGRFGARIWDWLERDRDPTAFVIVGALVWLSLGYWWFASKVAIALGTYGDVMKWVSTVVWLAAPIVMGVVLSLRRKRKPADA